MRVGDRLPAKLEQEILTSSHFLVLLTRKALASRWVNMEIEIAEKASDSSLSIIPILGETNLHTSLLDKFVGADISDKAVFEKVMDQLALLMRGHPQSERRDRECLTADLDRIVKEVPSLLSLVNRGANHLQIADTILLKSSISDEVETFLMVLYELAEDASQLSVAQLAANFFRRAGIGFDVMAKFLLTVEKGDDTWPVFQELSSDKGVKALELIDRYMQLFCLVRWPLDTHFRWFMENQFDQMNDAQKNLAVSYLLSPKRGPGSGAIDLAYYLYSRLPLNTSLESLWEQWAYSGALISGEDPAIFFRMMRQATKEGLFQFDSVMSAFQSHCRGLARSGIPTNCLSVAKILCKAGEEHYPRRRELAEEMQRAVGSYEWKQAPMPEAFTSSFLRITEMVLRDNPNDARNELLAAYRALP